MPPLFSGQQHPLAIAMWDFSWLRRSYPGGGFEDWPGAVSGLAERGYDAVRLDCFPHLLAADQDGKKRDTYQFPAKQKDHAWALWGNRWTFETNVRAGVHTMLGLLCESKFKIGLSTWLCNTDPDRSGLIGDPADFARMWDEALNEIKACGYIDHILYVDLANEYPLWHGWSWLKKELARRSTGQNTQASADGGGFNHEQKEFYWNAIQQVITTLQKSWPQIRFGVSQTFNYWEEQTSYDYSQFGFIDPHLWLVHGRKWIDSTGYWKLHAMETDQDFAAINASIHCCWDRHRDEWSNWLESKIRECSRLATRWAIPVGNTEGWGPIFWWEHPGLDWRFVKEAGELGAKLGAQYGYAFNCTSNFTHPFFPTIWNDIGWHQKVTSIIRRKRDSIN